MEVLVNCMENIPYTFTKCNSSILFCEKRTDTIVFFHRDLEVSKNKLIFRICVIALRCISIPEATGIYMALSM